jgi:hypothetical protein
MEKWKLFTLPGLELPLPLVVQPVASRYTDWAWSLRLIKHMSWWGMGGHVITRWSILNWGTRWRWMVSFTQRPPYPRGRSFLYPLGRRWEGPRVGLDVEIKENLHLCPVSNPDSSFIQPYPSRYTNWALPALRRSRTQKGKNWQKNSIGPKTAFFCVLLKKWQMRVSVLFNAFVYEAIEYVGNGLFVYSFWILSIPYANFL